MVDDEVECYPVSWEAWASGLGGLELPFPFDLAEMPDGQGDDPGDHEDADDDEPGAVDVEVPQEVPEPAGEVGTRLDRPRISMVPMNKATNTDRPVMVRL